MPTITTYWTYGQEEIELLANLWKANHYLEVKTHLEIFDRWGLQRIQLDLPTLTGISTYINAEVDELNTNFFDGSYSKAISRAIIEYPNPALQEIMVTVVSTDFHFDGVNINDSEWSRNLIKGVTYRFNQEAVSYTHLTLPTKA